MNLLEDQLQTSRAKAVTSDSASVASIPVPLESSRRALLNEEPLLVGASWARSWCETMRTEGRGVHGGWPGTLPEARVRILQHLDLDLARRGMPLLNEEEIVAVTTLVYAKAKRDWLEVARGVQAAASVKPGARRSKA